MRTVASQIARRHQHLDYFCALLTHGSYASVTVSRDGDLPVQLYLTILERREYP